MPVTDVSLDVFKQKIIYLARFEYRGMSHYTYIRFYRFYSVPGTRSNPRNRMQ